MLSLTADERRWNVSHSTSRGYIRRVEAVGGGVRRKGGKNGRSRGFGRTLAEAVLAQGHKLVATARNPAQLAHRVERYGDQVRTVDLDVTDARRAARSNPKSKPLPPNVATYIEASNARNAEALSG
jgi:short chain dehydrogenase